jgi:hypothetical protein
MHVRPRCMPVRSAAPCAEHQQLRHLGLLQVSAFGSDTQTDGGDNWTIEWDTKGKFWRQNTKVSTHTVAMHVHGHEGRGGCC